MTTLADDLLKTRSIADLRVLIKQLHKDAEDKKSELRSMVGSQYQTFLQSADKIADMHSQSKELLMSLDQFWERNQDFVGQVQGFLEQDAKNPVGEVPKPTKSTHKMSLEDVTSSNIWKDLGDCNVYAATKKIVTAAVLVHQPSSDGLSMLPTYFSAVQAGSSQDLPRAIVRELKSCLFLTETVIDDARMLCTEDVIEDNIHDNAGSGVEETAKTFASLSALLELQQSLSCSNLAEPTAVVDMLDLYLTHAVTQTEQLFEAHLAVANRTESIADGMLLLIRFLQKLVLEIYVLFFQPLQTNEEYSVQGLVYYQREVLRQEVARNLGTIINKPNNNASNSLSNADSNHVHDIVRVRKWLKTQLRKVTDRASVLLSSLASAAQVAQLQQQVYSACLAPNVLQQEVFAAISVHRVWRDACQALLLSSHAPAAATSLTVNDTLPTLQKTRSAHQMPSTTAAAPPSAPVDAIGEVELREINLLLWTRVFRVSFLHQVERLLQKACEEIFVDVQRALHGTLEQLGLRIVYSSKTARSQQQSSEGIGTGLHSSPRLTIVPIARSHLHRDAEAVKHLTEHLVHQPISSAQIYLLAERIRYRLDTQLLTLLDEVITPVQLSEKHAGHSTKTTSGSASSSTSSSGLSGQALMEALQANCCRLLGQLSSLLRQVAERCRRLLQEEGVYAPAKLFGLPVDGKQGGSTRDKSPLVKTLQRHFLYNSGNKGSQHHQTSANSGNWLPATRPESELTKQSALSALLLIGRLAWLLRVHQHSQLTRSSLLSSSSGPHQNSSNLTTSVNRVSEEQCRSAFEISDTDGDGVIHLAEAVDALRALCVGERENEILSLFHVSSSSAQTRTTDRGEDEHKASDELPSVQSSLTELRDLTYEEFLLVCGPALQVPATELLCLQRFHAALDHLVVLSHLTYLTALVSSHTPAFAQGLGKELASGHNRLHWRLHEVDLDGQGAVEKLWLPNQISIALQSFLYDISRDVFQTTLSADTLIPLLPEDKVDSTSEEGSDEDEEEEVTLSSLSSLLRSGAESATAAVSLQTATASWAQIILQLVVRDLGDVLVQEVLAKTQALPPARRTGSSDRRQLFFNFHRDKNGDNDMFITQAQQQQILDDASLQVVVDILVIDSLWLSKTGSKSCLGGLVESSQALMDPVLFELTSATLHKSLVPRIVAQSRLLYVVGDNTKDSSDGSSSKYESGNSGSFGTAAPDLSSEQLLSRLFSTQLATNNSGSSTASVAVSSTPSIPRLSLLPMALPSTASVTTATSNSASNTTTIPSSTSKASLQSAAVTASSSKPKSSSTGSKWW